MTRSGPATLAAMLGTARQQLRVFALFVVVLNLGVPLVLLIYVHLTGESYWRFFRSQDNFIEWLSSVQLLVVAAVAYANHKAARLWCRWGVDAPPRHSWIWLVFAIGFVVFGLDERFDLHEALRDVWLEPSGFFVDLRWMIDGDAGLYCFFAIGLALTPFLWDELRRGVGARGLFVAALALTLPTVIIDAMPDRAMADWPARRFWDYTFEELGEVWAQFLFLLSFLSVLSARLGSLEAVGRPTRPEISAELDSAPTRDDETDGSGTMASSR